MSQLSSSLDAELPEGYLRVHGGAYEMVLYRGFVRAAHVTVGGGTTVPLYEQTQRYDVPGGQPPAARSNVILKGGTHGRDVHLQIVNEPQEPGTGKGPVGAIRVQLGTPGAGGPAISHPEYVRILRGEEQVVRIDVVLREGVGGQEPYEFPEPLETGVLASVTEMWVVEDNASTCPFDC